MTKKKPSFRDELEQLEAIVRQLEKPDVDLDEALGGCGRNAPNRRS
jgi:exonuclease VII small subunit